ncbi:hypothetical protein LOK49_LG07G01380 [Camellia lanceoleosa]|uniref:Uncharacterized protein n=1 Tax=Camellia lanceoleosa TaxID=1840588 RepID=A0ACC0GYH1_9ERIC|nr:hypothetical protein LOK49_LG07G01380 [Camellia lanceoleosa]
MALNSSSSHLSSISFHFKNPRSPLSAKRHVLLTLSSPDESPKPSLRISADSAPKARFIARRRESVSVRELARPLMEYMSLPASQYSVLDAERIERVDNSTFRCYVYNFKFFAFEVCPVLLVRVEEEPNGCCIKLLSCKLEGSPIVVAQNEKFDASMVNRVSCDRKQGDSSVAELTSDTVIEVSIEIPFAFRPIPVQAIESTGTQVLEQILRIMLPRFMAQLVKTTKHGHQEIPQGSPLEPVKFRIAEMCMHVSLFDFYFIFGGFFCFMNNECTATRYTIVTIHAFYSRGKTPKCNFLKEYLILSQPALFIFNHVHVF